MKTSSSVSLHEKPEKRHKVLRETDVSIATSVSRRMFRQECQVLSYQECGLIAGVTYDRAGRMTSWKQAESDAKGTYLISSGMAVIGDMAPKAPMPPMMLV